MSLFEKIQSDWKIAFKAKEVHKKEILNYVLAQAKNKKIELGTDVSDDEMIKIIKKEIKTRMETISFSQQQGNLQEVEIDNEKVAILQSYLPVMLDEDKLSVILDKKIQELGIKDLNKQRGVVIGSIMKEYGGAVDGGLLNRLIQTRL